MAWNDRIQIAAYTSPSGTRFEFQYENIGMESDKKTGEFIFSEIDGQYIQDLGRAGRRFPFIIFFSGPDYDTQSDSFFQALEEKGIGTLEHPLYGTRKVVPTGTITRRDDLITGANQAVFSITFSETIVDINFPSSELNEKTDIQSSVDTLDDSISDQYAEKIDPETESESILIQNDLIEKKDMITETMEVITSINEEIQNAMDIVADAFDSTVLDIVLNPGGVASQMITIINTPSNIITYAEAQIEGYGSVIDTVINGVIETVNDYHNSNMIVSTSFGALCLSMLNADFLYRPQAVSTCNSIIDIYEQITEWMDEQITALGIEETEEAYHNLNQVYSKIVGYLIRLSFDLPKEIILTLQEDRQLIELVAELYGDLDMIDFFIQTNDLTTDEIELLPQGKQVVYYE